MTLQYCKCLTYESFSVFVCVHLCLYQVQTWSSPVTHQLASLDHLAGPSCRLAEELWSAFPWTTYISTEDWQTSCTGTVTTDISGDMALHAYQHLMPTTLLEAAFKKHKGLVTTSLSLCFLHSIIISDYVSETLYSHNDQKTF